MKILAHPKFDKAYKKRILPDTKLHRQFKKRLQMYIKNPNHPLLRDHQLEGSKKKFRSFSITGDVRAIYEQNSSKQITLHDIGAHNQVY